jgi:hypothetical protein
VHVINTVLNNPYFQGVASSYIAVAIAFIVGMPIYRITRRRRLLRFFGCTSNHRIRLYLSNLDIALGGARDPSGQIRTFHGSAAPGHELPFIPALYQLFLAPVPGLSTQPGWWRALAMRDVDINVSPSPRSAQAIDDSATLITVGSVGYNTVSAEVEKNFKPSVQLLPEGAAISPDKVRYEGIDYAILAKCRHPSRKQWAFYAAGPTRIGTTSAFQYLIQNWSALRKEFGDQTPFSVVIRVIDDDSSRLEVVHRYRHHGLSFGNDTMTGVFHCTAHALNVSAPRFGVT